MRRNRGRRITRAAAGLLVALVVFVQMLVPALADEGQRVRIGCFPLNGFCDIAADGTVSGYVREFTDEVVSHTGWDCDYVRFANWEEALDALSAGNLDILAPAQHTPERDEIYTFDSFPIGTEYGSMLTLSTNDTLVFEDYSAFCGLDVGVVESLVFLDDFLEYEARNGFAVNLAYYKDTPALVAALNAGEVDAIVANLMVKTETMKTLAKFGSAPYYYILSPKSDRLRSELNQAIDRILTQHPNYQNELTDMYFPAYNDIPLSKQELDYIASAGVLNVACAADLAPYSYLDPVTNEICGFDRSVLERISQLTGLRFVFEAIRLSENTEAFLEANSISVVAGVENDQRSRLHDSIFTDPYFSVGKYFVGLAGESFDTDTLKTVAVVCAAEAQLDKWQQRFPNFTFARVPSVDEGIKALHNGGVKLLLSDRYSMENALAAPQNHDLQFMPTQAMTGLIGYKVTTHDDGALLVSILNKAIRQISGAETNQFMDDSLRATRYQYGIVDFLYQYRSILIAGAAVILAGLLALSIILRTREKTRQQIARDELKLRNITNNINGGVVVLKADEGLEITYANKGFLELIGCTQEQFDQIGHGSYLAYVHPDDLGKIRAAIASSNRELSLELRVFRSDNRYIPALFNCTVGEVAGGEKELYCVILDLTEQNKLLEELRIESRRTELILERVEEIFYEVNLRENTIHTSGSFSEKLGWNLPTSIEAHNEDVFSKMWLAAPEDVTKLHDATMEMLGHKKPVSSVIRIESKRQGGYIWCEVLQYPILTAANEIASVIGLIRDIDRQVTERERLIEQARRDPLTGLYNKEAFESMASDVLMTQTNQNHAIIFIDLDHFKSVNDTLGHMVGDRAICDAADKLRIIFSNYDLVARFGGDEFCIFVKNIPVATLRGKLDWLVDNLRAVYRGERGTVNVTCSCGVACTESIGNDYSALMQCADKALYYSKNAGRDRYTFSTDMVNADKDSNQ